MLSVGASIRRARAERGLSLRALSALAGVSVGLLSQSERGITDPSLQTLRSVAKALEMPLFDLFSPPDESVVAVVRRRQRIKLAAPHGEMTYSRISPGRGRLELLEGRLAPGAMSSEEPWSHASEECVVVVSGVLAVEVGGETQRLEVGDSCYFNSRLLHRYLNDGLDTAVFTVAITPPSY